jgi:hypothetical protein
LEDLGIENADFMAIWNQGCHMAYTYICIPKIPVWAYFGGPWNEKCWFILCPFGIFYGHLV